MCVKCYDLSLNPLPYRLLLNLLKLDTQFINPLPHMPISRSSNSALKKKKKKNRMSKIWTNGAQLSD